ncbi:hypothetical protein C1H46_029624 [Malus baccata]|uniref:Uncharacterized protein n=1 Tax=Malus baccata TaxID=106549 RepID=A0A540LEE6_MALBA|nr:hypothetical protein C1H46_029624 [Malus baccata]
MHPYEIVRTVLVYPLARVFPTPPLSLCYMSVSAMSFVGFHELHTDSWLLSLSCQLSLVYGYAHVANRVWKWHLLKWCSAAEMESNGFAGSGRVEKVVEGVKASSLGNVMLSLGLNVFWAHFVFSSVLGPLLFVDM